MSLSPLERTFAHIQGVGRNTENSLWEEGVTSWYEALAIEESSLPPGTIRRVKENCNISTKKLFERDWKYFMRLLPPNEQWRLFGSLPGPTAFIDIETTGVLIDSSLITIVGLFDGDVAYIYMNEFRDLRERPPIRTGKYKVIIQPSYKLAEKMDQVTKIVSFNGRSFDIPILRRHYPDIDFNLPHLDLKVAFRSIGRKGGLKKLETEFQIERPFGVQGLHGGDAVGLWARYRMEGDLQALATLIEYNVQDIVNLKELTRIFLETRLNAFPKDTRVFL